VRVNKAQLGHSPVCHLLGCCFKFVHA